MHVVWSSFQVIKVRRVVEADCIRCPLPMIRVAAARLLVNIKATPVTEIKAYSPPAGIRNERTHNNFRELGRADGSDLVDGH